MSTNEDQDSANVQDMSDSRGSPGALVVTGGGRGIGAQIALRAARTGTPVAIIYRSRSAEASEVVRKIEASGGRAIAIAANISSEHEVIQAFEKIENQFGAISGLVNNAVIAGPSSRLAELKAQDIEEVFATNVFGAFFCAREAAKRLSIKNGGSGGGIVSISSVLAIKTGAPGTWVPFAASKSAIETMSLGLEGVGVRRNSRQHRSLRSDRYGNTFHSGQGIYRPCNGASAPRAYGGF